MNGKESPSNTSPRTYSSEYVELKTELRDLSGLFRAEMAKVIVKMESMERCIRDHQRESYRLENQVQTNRTAVASLKTMATMLGGAAGILGNMFARFFGRGEGF